MKRSNFIIKEKDLPFFKRGVALRSIRSKREIVLTRPVREKQWQFYRENPHLLREEGLWEVLVTKPGHKDHLSRGEGIPHGHQTTGITFNIALWELKRLYKPL